MQAREIVRKQFSQLHEFIDATMGDVTQEIADARVDAPINSIGQIYAHMAVAEDAMVGRVRGSMIITSGDWRERTGISGESTWQDDDWGKQAFDIDAVRDYARAVFAGTDDYLATASDEELAEVFETPMGDESGLWFIAGITMVHLVEHWGEIAALKGVQGIKGPF